MPLIAPNRHPALHVPATEKPFEKRFTVWIRLHQCVAQRCLDIERFVQARQQAAQYGASQRSLQRLSGCHKSGEKVVRSRGLELPAVRTEVLIIYLNSTLTNQLGQGVVLAIGIMGSNEVEAFRVGEGRRDPSKTYRCGKGICIGEQIPRVSEMSYRRKLVTAGIGKAAYRGGA